MITRARHVCPCCNAQCVGVLNTAAVLQMEYYHCLQCGATWSKPAHRDSPINIVVQPRAENK